MRGTAFFAPYAQASNSIIIGLLPVKNQGFYVTNFGEGRLNMIGVTTRQDELYLSAQMAGYRMYA
jgi:hypothetical protein